MLDPHECTAHTPLHYDSAARIVPRSVTAPKPSLSPMSAAAVQLSICPTGHAQVPRLHAILVRRQTSAVPILSPDLATVAALLPALRLTALELLAEAAGGDHLVAEYLLLQLVSRCGARAQDCRNHRQLSQSLQGVVSD